MRKLAKGLYHVGRGGSFDSSKLFATRRLQVGGVATANPRPTDAEHSGFPRGDLQLQRISAPCKSAVCLGAP
jgi:hypothetical protein